MPRPTASITGPAARQARRVARYYKWLDRLSWFDERRAEEGHGALPVHRSLRDPAGGPPSPWVIHDLMLDGLSVPEAPRVLDAGCGYGATMLHLAPRLGGDWTGLTLSDVQAARGNAQCAAQGLGDRVRVEVGSYDAPLPPERFDLIYGIESLIHSADPAATIRNLGAALAPGGHLVIVDDMPVDEAMGEEPAARLACFRRYWRCPVAPTRSGWQQALRGAGLDVVAERDLNPLLLSRSMQEVAGLLATVERRSRLARLFGFGVRAEAEIGGLLLETLHADGHMQYRVMAGRKPAG